MMITREGNSGPYRIGRDFVEAACAAPVWQVQAAGYVFEVCYSCTGDDACAAVRDVLAKHGKQAAAFQFQRC